jgi:hypothetical protein
MTAFLDAIAVRRRAFAHPNLSLTLRSKKAGMEDKNLGGFALLALNPLEHQRLVVLQVLS